MRDVERKMKCETREQSVFGSCLRCRTIILQWECPVSTASDDEPLIIQSHYQWTPTGLEGRGNVVQGRLGWHPAPFAQRRNSLSFCRRHFSTRQSTSDEGSGVVVGESEY